MSPTFEEWWNKRWAEAEWYEIAKAAWEAAQPKWIPVSERFPTQGWYLVYQGTVTGNMLHEIAFFDEEVGFINCVFPVTHWMPLPEPPTGE